MIDIINIVTGAARVGWKYFEGYKWNSDGKVSQA